MIDYSIVIPAYNESDKIITSLNQVINFMSTFCETYEVLVVDDGSSDNTAELIQSYQSDHPQVKLIKNVHKGKGPTVWTGIMQAEGKYIYMADADFSTPIQELKKLSNWMIEHDFDLVIASREGLGANRVNEPIYRHIMGRIFNFFVQTLAVPGIKDSQCGFKLFKQAVAKDIFSRMRVYNEVAKELKGGYMGAFDVEVLFLARKLGYKIKEVSVPWTYVKTTRLNPIADSVRMTFDVLKVRYNDLKGVYNNN